jgi:transposase
MRQRTESAVTRQSSSSAPFVIGLDLGDKWSRYCVLDSAGAILEEDRVRSNAESLREQFGSLASTRIVIETGTHSPWVSRVLEGMGHSAVVANARKLRMIYESDRVPVEFLAGQVAMPVDSP